MMTDGNAAQQQPHCMMDAVDQINLSAVSSSDSSDDDTDWQKVPIKRKNSGSPNIYQQKRPHNDDEPGTSNRFKSLANDETKEGEVNNVKV